jgi:hypothetical protein
MVKTQYILPVVTSSISSIGVAMIIVTGITPLG